MYAIVCTQGDMTLGEVKRECVGGKWVPVLFYYEDETPIFPVFPSQDMAKRFAQRNVPKAWLTGCVNLDEDDVNAIRGKGVVVLMGYPKRIVAKYSVEVIEYHPDKDVEVQV